jgi:hypothetical protein
LARYLLWGCKKRLFFIDIKQKEDIMKASAALKPNQRPNPRPILPPRRPRGRALSAMHPLAEFDIVFDRYGRSGNEFNNRSCGLRGYAAEPERFSDALESLLPFSF